MNSKEFVIYLNGAIELGNITQLDTKNFSIVEENLKKVANDSTPEGIFCIWLKGYLEAHENLEVNEKQFPKISARVKELINVKEKPHITQQTIQEMIDKLPKQNPQIPFNHGEKLRC